MMEKIEGSQESIEDLRNSSSNPPWIELLDSLIEEIIEKLSLVDYIRFGAICKRWNLIQKEHRARYSPKPPPIVPSIVLVNYQYFKDYSNRGNDKELLFQLPFEQKNYHLPLPHPHAMTIYDSCCGWLLTKYNPNPHPSNLPIDHFHIYNPVTCVTIDLPPFSFRSYRIRSGSLSAPPTDPNCCAIITTGNKIFVLCLREFVWVKVQVTNDHDLGTFSHFVYLNGKFYRISSCTKRSLSIVDPFLPKPTEQILELDIEVMTENGELENAKLTIINGELFLVIAVYPSFKLIKRFHVFKANFTTRKWIRVTNLGDYAMLLSDNVMSLHVSSVEGLRKNMIYYTQLFYADNCADRQGTILTFDMDTQEIAEGSSPLSDKHQFNAEKTIRLFWFFPTV